MFDMSEIEELFKTEYLAKSKARIQALLRNAALLRDQNLTPEQRQIAEDNVRAITKGTRVKGAAAPKTPKQSKNTSVIAPPVQTAPAASVAAPGQVKLKYSPVYQHYGITQEHWNNAGPDAHKELFDHHNNVMAGKIPELGHIKTAVEQSKTKVLKSADNLYDLFTQLKKYL